MRCPIAACTFFAEHPYDAKLGNLNRATDFALRAVEMHHIQHRVLDDLDVGAGPGHDLGGEERLGQPTGPSCDLPEGVHFLGFRILNP